MRRRDPVAISGITLLELAQIVASGHARSRWAAGEAFNGLAGNPAFEILPLTIEIAREVTSLVGVLRDPADCVIAATARVHGLRLLTSDARILDANVVSTIG
jgi:predicted nucleic acid-binding protein